MYLLPVVAGAHEIIFRYVMGFDPVKGKKAVKLKAREPFNKFHLDFRRVTAVKETPHHLLNPCCS